MKWKEKSFFWTMVTGVPYVPMMGLVGTAPPTKTTHSFMQSLLPRDSDHNNGGTKDRIPELDGVRGIAILMVLLSHSMVIVRDTPISGIFQFGWIGVDLFFVLSGYLITGVLLRTRSDTNFYRRFYIRRALRIWPLYYALLAVALCALPALRHILPASNSLGTGTGFKTELLQIFTPWPLYVLFMQNLWPGSLFTFYDAVILHVTWSLCIEEHFYFTWPVFVRRFSRRSLALGLCALLFLFPVLRAGTGIELLRYMDFGAFYQISMRFTPLHLDAIAAGCLLSIVFNTVQPLARKTALAWLLLLGGAAVSSVAITSTNPILFAFFYCGMAATFSGFLALALLGWANVILTNSMLRYVGRISYGLYLIHPSVFIAFQSHAMYRRLHLAQHLAAAEYIAAAAAMAVSIGLAGVSWRFFESRALALKGSLAP